ncbi:cation transporter [Halobacteriales archaeon QS_1_68_20]|nr:MAG: cation transporter [Halobacteriales archaeon QS_1_68_20]
MVETYPVALVIIGVAIFGAVVLPRLLKHQPMSVPILYVVGGFVLFSLPHGVERPDMVQNSVIVEHLTELVVIVALMGAGLKIDKPFSWRGWGPTWRLLGITMPLTIAAAVVLGWGLLGMQPALAVLLGAVIAPTDPVLASDIEAGPPLTEMEEDPEETHQERRVRFSLTSEAGLNDGLAFPFTNLAIALAAATGVTAATSGSVLPGVTEYGWLLDWFLDDVVYKIVVGVVMGYVMGYAGGLLIFRLPASSRVAQTMEGAEALSGTLIIYGATEVVGGYGFLAVFVGALVLRQFEWKHDYYKTLNDYAVMVERLVMAAVLVLFGGALAGGLLDPLTWMDVVVGLALIVVVRPVAGVIGLMGSDLAWPARSVVASFGIRGIGSFYYLAYALNEASFQELQLLVAAERIWALVGFVVLSSIVIHGIASSPVMDAFEDWEESYQTAD